MSQKIITAHIDAVLLGGSSQPAVECKGREAVIGSRLVDQGNDLGGEIRV